MIPCSSEDRICHATFEGELGFIYMYEVVLRDLGVTFPFQPFEVDVLRTLGIAPSQLHPNNPYTLSLLALSFFTILRPKLVRKPPRCLFNDYPILTDHFKSRFLKIKSLGKSPFTAYTRAFSQYWRMPLWFSGYTRKYLSNEDFPYQNVDVRHLTSI
ncbi:hypothetical protein CR513_39469, partial [Mucuna pruriens]